MKAGLFFGSFNPIHIGHLLVASHFVELSDIEEVWFVVSPQNPLKEKKSLIDANTRLKMVEVAIKDNKSFQLSDIEFSLPKPSYTVNTLKHLKNKYPWLDFVLLMGSDTYAKISDWKDASTIVSENPIYIYKRRGSEIKLKKTDKNVRVFDFPYIDVSASYIRELMEKGKSVKYLVPEKALKILPR